MYDEGGTVEPAVGGYALIVLQQVTHYPDIHFQSELVCDLPLVRIELDPLQNSRCLGIVVRGFVQGCEGQADGAIRLLEGHDLWRDLVQCVGVEGFLQLRGEGR